MSKLLFCLLILINITGCDKVISKTKVSDTIKVEKTVSCSHSGYCYGCGLNYAGKNTCGYSYRSSCSGNQKAIVEETNYLYIYESGDKQQFKDSVIIERLTSCN